MNKDDSLNIAAAQRLVRQISTQSCLVYNQLCGTDSEEMAYRVLDGQLRMASQLAKLKGKVSEN
ncbi:MAG: hypothetical protein LUI06_06255 [Ruminococcus sp.]|nr:hypothetical protein [Ruminococcus sp.]